MKLANKVRYEFTRKDRSITSQIVWFLIFLHAALLLILIL